MDNLWIPISILATVVICFGALAVALRIYRPHSSLNRYTGLAAMLLIVCALAAGQVYASYGDKPIKSDDAARIYAYADWLAEDKSLQALAMIKQEWEEEPTTDRKLLLGLAYLNDLQTERAYRLLQEAVWEAKELTWFDAKRVEELLQLIEASEAEMTALSSTYSKLSTTTVAADDSASAEENMVHREEKLVLNAATEMLEEAAVELGEEHADSIPADEPEDADIDEPTEEGSAAEEAIEGSEAEALEESAGEAAESEASEEEAVDETPGEAEEVSEALEDEGTEPNMTDEDLEVTPSEIEEALPESFIEWSDFTYDPELGEQLAAAIERAAEAYRSWIIEEITRLKEEAVKKSELPEQALEWLADLDVERISFADALGGADWLDTYREAMAALHEEKIDSPLLKRTLAAIAIYQHDDRTAEQLLVELLLEYPQDEVSAAMLSELYLSGRIEPSEAARQLPQYAIAEERAERALRELEQEREAERAAQDEQAGSAPTDLNWSNVAERIANELAYTIVEPLISDKSSFQLDARLARYYFNIGDQEKSAEMIDSLTQKQEQMTIGQQRVLQQIEQQAELSGADVLDEQKREEQIRARERAFQMMHTPRQSWNPTIEDESFAYYVQEQLRFGTRQSVVITSIEADEDAKQVTLYVRAENIDDLKRSAIELMDNGTPITNYKLEKIGEAEYHNRSIGVVIDVSGSMNGDRIAAAKEATIHFFSSLKDFEAAELVAFNSSPSLVQDLTSDKQALQNAAGGLEAGGNTNISDALWYEISRMSDRSGQRVVFIFTDGEDGRFSQRETRASIIEFANGSGTPIFAVGFGAGYDTLSEVAEATGGQFIAAPNVTTILNGFADVARTLEKTYTITYTLDPLEPGRHEVELTVDDSLSTSRTYTIGSEDPYGFGDESDDVEVVQTDDRFLIQQVLPSNIQLDESAGAVISLDGIGLDKTDRLMLGKMRIRTFDVKDGMLQFKLPADLKEGPYTIKVRAKDGRESEAELNVMKPGMMQSVKFGWATVYGRSIETQGQEVRISGATSVDHFLYPSGKSDEMVLKNGEQLVFEGLHIAVDRTQLPLAGRMIVRGQQLSDKVIHPKVTMKLMDYGEFFKLSYGGADRLTFRRMGLEFYVSDISYYALKTDKAGRLETKMGLAGWNSAAKSAANVRLLSGIKFPNIPDAMITARFQPNNLMLRGDVKMPEVSYQTMFSAKNASLGVEYEFKTNRLLISGGFSELEILGRPLAVRAVKGGKLTLGWEGSLVPKAYGLTLTGDGIPLGPTGLTVNKFGVLLDFTSARQGSLEAGFGTVVDKVRPFIEKLNRIRILGYKPFDFDPDKVSLLQIDANLGVKKFLASDWEASGQAALSVFNFKLSEKTFRLNRNLMEFGTRFDLAFVFLLDGKNTVIYSDPRKSNHLTIGYIGKLTGPAVDLNANWVVVPANISSSAYSFKGKAGGFDVNYHMGELNVYK